MTRDNTIRRLLYQSSHRGCKETDAILGNFAKENLENFSDEELKIFEQLLNEDDWEIYNWVVSKNFPEKYQNRITDLLLKFDFSK